MHQPNGVPLYVNYPAQVPPDDSVVTDHRGWGNLYSYHGGETLEPVQAVGRVYVSRVENKVNTFKRAGHLREAVLGPSPADGCLK